jgi:catechol 2,3-dioxygenase-like lactoylglutathione lyase family enzyme
MPRRTSRTEPDSVPAIIPRVSGVVETCLHVADVETSARFYERIFGFERMAGDARFCAFAVTPKTSREKHEAPGAWHSVLLLFLRGASVQPIAVPGGLIPPHDGAGRLHFAFAIPAEDFEQWQERLADLGIAIESRVRWEGGGQSLYFRDPDDHLVELATPGIWPNY